MSEPCHDTNAGGRVECPYCGGRARLVDSASVYHGISYGMLWDCRPCDAYVGVHRNSPSHEPLGRLANVELRAWKIMAHNAFDPLWKSGQMSRSDAYALLRKLMGLPKAHAHIGLFDVGACKQLVDRIREYNKAYA